MSTGWPAAAADDGRAAADRRAVRPAVEVYEAGLRAAERGTATGWRVRYADGSATDLPLAAWTVGERPGDRSLLARCAGPTLDLGCGPGRLTALLAARGVPALGVDLAPHAVALCRDRGGTALRRDLFGRLPGEGRWRHLLLADGNVGIGGDPAALLRRCARLLHPRRQRAAGDRPARHRAAPDPGPAGAADRAAVGVVPVGAPRAGRAGRARAAGRSRPGRRLDGQGSVVRQAGPGRRGRVRGARRRQPQPTSAGR